MGKGSEGKSRDGYLAPGLRYQTREKTEALCSSPGVAGREGRQERAEVLGAPWWDPADCAGGVAALNPLLWSELLQPRS